MDRSKPIEKLKCRIGLHQFRVIEIKFGFGSAGKVEVAECERCKKVITRSAR